MTVMFRSVITVFVVVLLCASVEAAKLKGQAVTWADFSYVNYIAASFSHVYFATTKGIIRFNKLEDRWEEPLTGAVGLEDENIERVWVNTFDNKLVAEMSVGLSEYDALFDKWFPVSELPSLDNDDRHIKPPVIMHPPIGFTYWDDGRLVDGYNRQYYINDIVDDRSGTLWIGTWGYGTARAGNTSYLIDLLPYGLLQNRVNALLKHDGLLWISGAVFDSRRTGISVFDPEDNRFFHIESGLDTDFPAVDVNCLEADDSTIYIGTPIGLLCMDRETKRVTRSFSRRSGLGDDNVISVETIGDSIFVGTAGGLSVITGADDSVRYIRPGQFLNRVIYDLEEVDSSLWIAASSGAYRLKLPSGKLQQFKDPDLVLFGDVYDIERYEDDLWFTSDDGVVRLDIKTGETEPFWLAAQKIVPRALAVNDTIAAVASNKGMFFIYYKNRNQFTREFTTEDGLASNDINSLLMDGDYIWVGTDKGLTRFWWNNPDRVD